MSAKYDFPIEQGSSFRLTFVYKDADGNPINLTNWCGRLIWKTNTSETATFVIGHSSSDYSFLMDAPNGKITLLLPSSVTNSYTFNTAKYDIELQSPDDFYNSGGNYTVRLLYGTITITKRFSQSTNDLACQP